MNLYAGQMTTMSRAPILYGHKDNSNSYDMLRQEVLEI